MANGAPNGDGTPAGGMPLGDIPDLADLKGLPREMIALGGFLAELNEGKRCVGCERRITQGVHFTKYTPQIIQGQPTVVAVKRAACLSDDCDYQAQCYVNADVMEPVEFVWLDRERARDTGEDPDEAEELTMALVKLGRGQELTEEEQQLVERTG